MRGGRRRHFQADINSVQGIRAGYRKGHLECLDKKLQGGTDTVMVGRPV